MMPSDGMCLLLFHVEGDEDTLFTDYYGAMTYVSHLMEVD